MLYELVGIARYVPENKDAVDLVRRVGSLILTNRGVVRKLENWGVRPLPRVWNVERQSHIVGSHFYIRFDSSPAVLNQIKRIMREDARVLRTTFVRLGGDSLDSLLEPPQL